MHLKGKISFLGDKSISHRALMVASISNGKSILRNIPDSNDVKSTINVLRMCGIRIEVIDETVTVYGGTLRDPLDNLQCGNSGTTIRLLTGLLLGQNIKATLIGDSSLSRRPMDRIIDPLTKMGAKIKSDSGRAPISIDRSNIKSINYNLDISSAQVKSCVMLAALGNSDITTIKGSINTRDHLENLITHIKKNIITVKKDEIKIKGPEEDINAFSYDIPGDISSSACFIALATVLHGSNLTINNILLNEKRLGFIHVLNSMGAKIKLKVDENRFGEDVGSVTVEGVKKLRGCVVPKHIIHSLIDEIPLLSLMCTLSKGRSRIEGLEELRYKESDRLRGIEGILSSLGGKVNICDEALIIDGIKRLYHTNKISNYMDHRLAMMICAAELIIGVKPSYHDCINVSLPGFRNKIESVLVK